ncbi:MAG: hypothetical protein JNL40_03825 [Cyclobacteriaceae bacterium]|nr:hypothetical protein [Cyclobacteriaceae bacterium]
MKKSLLTKNLLLGFLSWLIPYLFSFLFFRPGGELVVAYATFKSAVTVVGVGTGCYLMYRYFKYVETDFVRNGVIVGVSWMVLNLVFDAIFLMPMAKLDFGEYFMTIGLSYLAIPPLGILVGYVLERGRTLTSPRE